MEMSKRGLDGKNMVSFIDELVSLKKNLELKFYDDVPEEILNKWKKIHELAKVKLNDQERKSKMNFGRRTDSITNAYHDFDIQLNRDQSISFKVYHDFNKYGLMNRIPSIDKSDETKKVYYKKHLDSYQYVKRDQVTMGSFWSDEKIEKSDDENTVSSEIRLKRYSKDLDFIINILELDSPLLGTERSERSNLSEAILEKQKNIYSELLLFRNDDNRFSKFAKIMEVQNQDDYQFGEYLADGGFEGSEPRDLRLRIYDYELRVNGDEMFIYKSNNGFRHKDRELDPLPFFSEQFKGGIGDKCWFVFDKDVPYIEQEELGIDEDEFGNPIPDDNGNISIRSLDGVNFNQDEYNEALRIIEHFLSQF